MPKQWKILALDPKGALCAAIAADEQSPMYDPPAGSSLEQPSK